MDSARKESYRQADSLDAPAAGADGDEGRPLGERVPDDGRQPRARRPQRPAAAAAASARSRRCPEEQREVFLLREYSGIAFKEIAEVTGVSENTVKSRMRYALEGPAKTPGGAGRGRRPAEDGRTVRG